MPKLYTDKKDKKISLYILWNSKGSGAKLYMTNELLIYGEEKKYLGISSYIKKPFLIYEYAPDPIWISLIYEENFVAFFISVFV